MKPGTSSKRSHPPKPAEHCSHSRGPRTESTHADTFACGACLHGDRRRNSEVDAAPAFVSKSGLAHEAQPPRQLTFIACRAPNELQQSFGMLPAHLS